ncbi:MAG: type VI secretion system ImpA family N-terminal domain-containing protein [Planctomycetes bacterium]|nr:type VI secretion system ImpA family N-terminal domain-containing protein [Planctomycetota bacterium]
MNAPAPAQVSIATTPINAAQPSGESARYDAEFLRLEEQLGKLGSLTGGAVDWSQIEVDATAILTRRSKDVLVAVYLARAWFQLRGPAGLRDGLGLVRDLLATFWDSCFPLLARVRARRAALQWLGDGIEPLAPGLAADPAKLAECRAIVDAIIAFAAGRFEDDDCGLSGLRRALVRAAEMAQADGIAQAEVQAQTDQPIEDYVNTTRTDRPRPSMPAGAIADRDEAIRRLREVADWFQRSEPHGPVGFLVQRAVHWSGMSFQEVFRDLLANNAQAQNELWQSLGLRPPESRDG